MATFGMASMLLYSTLLVGFAALTHRRPVWGLAGLLFVIPLGPSSAIGHTTITLSKIALLGIGLGVIGKRTPLHVLADRRVMNLLLAAVAIVATTALSFAQADFKEPASREVLKSCEYLLGFVLAVVCFADDPDRRIIGVAIFVVIAVVSLLALSQEFTTAPSGMFVGKHVVPRVAGPLEGPNQLGGYLGLLLPFMAAYALRARIGIAGWGCISLAVCALVLTFSRAGVLSAIVAVAIVFLIDGQRNMRIASAFVAPVVAAAAAVMLVGGELSHFWSTRSQLQDDGLGTRSELWSAAYQLWRAHPLLGIGAGNYEMELGRAGFPELHTHANSGYIQAAVEGGLPALAALLWATWLSIATFVKARVREPLIVGAVGASAGFALHEVFDFLAFYPKVGLTFWFLLGIAVAALFVAEPVRERSQAHVSIQ